MIVSNTLTATIFLLFCIISILLMKFYSQNLTQLLTTYINIIQWHLNSFVDQSKNTALLFLSGGWNIKIYAATDNFQAHVVSYWNWKTISG